MTFLYALCMIYAVQDCPSTQEEDSDSSCTWGGGGGIYIYIAIGYCEVGEIKGKRSCGKVFQYLILSLFSNRPYVYLKLVSSS